jgi:exosortase/archaeosortase family protein
MASVIIHAFGINSSIEGSQVLKSTSGFGINLWLPCLGLGITSFWMAFIVSQKTSLINKFTWCVGGIAAIWFINCWRIALLLVSLDFGWESTQFIDHHGIFNIVAYGLVVALVLMFNRQEQRKKTN